MQLTTEFVDQFLIYLYNKHVDKKNIPADKLEHLSKLYKLIIILELSHCTNIPIVTNGKFGINITNILDFISKIQQKYPEEQNDETLDIYQLFRELYLERFK